MYIVFTRSNSLLSKLIRRVTGEPVSHCALVVSDQEVIHSNLTGLHITSLGEFQKSSRILYRIEAPHDEAKLDRLVERHAHARYDYGALLYLGLRCLCPWLPKKNLWQTSGMYLCTEWVTEVLDGQEDHMITPYKLYQKLEQRYGLANR